MKSLPFILSLLLCTALVKAQPKPNAYKHKPVSNEMLKYDETPPAYPGGARALNKVINSNLKYPELARLLGINGKIWLSFIIDTAGKITNITPLNCIGAGCESEAVRALSMCQQWQPAKLADKPVRVQYSLPITFTANKPKITFKELRRTNYAFVFEIHNTEYTIDEAERILGRSFSSNMIEIAMPYADQEKHPEFTGREAYLLKIKTV